MSIHIVWCWRCWDRLIQEIKAMSKVSKIDQIHLRAVMLCMSKMSKMGKTIHTSFEKLRLRAFQPYHQILCILKHVKDVEDRSNTPACSVQNNVKDIKTSHNRFLTDFLEFISLLSETWKMFTNYNVDSDMKSSNYSKIRFKPLIYFELQWSLN